MNPKIWFITGISRGLGLGLARAVLARGDVVVGTTRDGSSPDGIDSTRLSVLPLEMTDRAQIQQAVAAAHNRHGRLDVVVNNAGYGLLGSVEEARPQDVDHLFTVNFFGPLSVIQASLPLLRVQRHGHIVNISSIAGFAPAAGAGLYAASKFALDGLSQSLAQEVAPLGLRVTVVEPGAFRTDFLSPHSLRRTAGDIEDYRASSGRSVDGLLSRAGQQLGDPDRAALAIIEAVDADKPPLHLLLGSDALRRARVRLDQFETDLRHWEEVSRRTDFASETGAESAR